MPRCSPFSRKHRTKQRRWSSRILRRGIRELVTVAGEPNEMGEKLRIVPTLPVSLEFHGAECAMICNRLKQEFIDEAGRGKGGRRWKRLLIFCSFNLLLEEKRIQLISKGGESERERKAGEKRVKAELGKK